VMLLCGKRGDLAVHTPESCFPSIGMEPAEAKVATPVKSQDGATSFGTFEAQRYKPTADAKGAVPSRVYWAWSKDGVKWESPTNPRITFAAVPFLYKVYVVRDDSEQGSERGGPSTAQGKSSDLCEDFLRDFLPVISGRVTAKQTDNKVNRGEQ